MAALHKYAEGRLSHGSALRRLEYLDVYFPHSETGPHMSQAGLELAKELRVTLNFWSTCLQPLSAEVTDMSMPPHPLYAMPGIKARVWCIRGEHTSHYTPGLR